MPLCGYSDEDRDYARELHLQGLEDHAKAWSEVYELAEQYLTEADERGDAKDRAFWEDMLGKFEQRWKVAQAAYDDQASDWGMAA